MLNKFIINRLETHCSLEEAKLKQKYYALTDLSHARTIRKK